MAEAEGANKLQLGMLAMQRGDLKQGESYIRQAIRSGIPDKDGAAMAYLQMCQIYMNKQHFKAAKDMFRKAKTFQQDHITQANTWEEFVELLDGKTGFISAHWDGTGETEDAIKEKTKATIRCIPLDNAPEAGTCILTGKPSTQRVLFARAY